MITTPTSSVNTASRNTVWAILSLSLVIITAILVHSYNMFGFPLYLGDEGIYMARAYSVLELGWITPYTYWYDHPPAGWLLVALWTLLTGGFSAFGTAVDGGRVLMLLLHVLSIVSMFYILLRLTGNELVATIACLLYTLSPLTITYSRLVLLDNIMIFWTLLAAALLLGYTGRLWPLVFGGFCFGVAVLSKEVAFLLLPAFVYGVWKLSKQGHARFARVGWFYAALSTISLYPLYAALRTELIEFSFSSPQASDGSVVSLIGSVLWQLSRSGGLPWDPSSQFHNYLINHWLVKDPWILGVGALATLWSLVQADHAKRMIGWLSVLAVVAIAHGNQVFEFYVIPILPLFALNFGLLLAQVSKLMRSQSALLVAAMAVVAVSWFNLNQQRNIFALDMTTIQRQALDWVREHVPPDAQIVTDDDLWVDLRGGRKVHQGFPGAHSHWQTAGDPAISQDLFHNDWRLIDYLILTPDLDQIFATAPDRLPHQAYSQSTPVVTFSVGKASVEVRKVNHAGLAVREMVNHTYDGFKSQYIHEGQVRSGSGYTDARDEASAMLMAVWMDDQATFDELWTWTTIHLQSEIDLLYHTNEPGAALHTTTDANTDAALALLLAERRWNDVSYGRAGREIIRAIWEHTVVEIDGRLYLAAGDWAISEDRVIFAPATFAPYAYHFFAAADPEHDWWYLLDTSYQLLADVTQDPLGENRAAGLPPTYVGIDRITGEFLPDLGDGLADSNHFTEQAAQVYWRVGLDAQWHNDGRAESYLTASRFLHNEWQAKNRLATRYAHSGKLRTNDESLLMYSLVLPKFVVEDPAAAHELYAKKLAPVYRQKGNKGLWGRDQDFGQERWAWLSSGLYANIFQHQWDTGTVSSAKLRPPVWKMDNTLSKTALQAYIVGE